MIALTYLLTVLLLMMDPILHTGSATTDMMETVAIYTWVMAQILATVKLVPKLVMYKVLIASAVVNVVQ